jgi:hypothetical protein
MGAEFLPQTPWDRNTMGKHHGKNSWRFMGAEFLPQTPWGRNTMGKIHGVSWLPNFYLKRHGVETPWEKLMAFHCCRISTSNAMGFFMGFSMGDFYKGHVQLYKL